MGPHVMGHWAQPQRARWPGRKSRGRSGLWTGPMAQSMMSWLWLDHLGLLGESLARTHQYGSTVMVWA